MPVVLFNGQGTRRTAIIVQTLPHVRVEATAEVIHTENYPHLVLLQSLTNEPGTLDDVVRLGTELGIREFYPVFSDRSERSRWPNRRLRDRTERWKRIAVEACKQSKNSFLPEIHPPSTLEEFRPPLGICLLCLPQAPPFFRQRKDILSVIRSFPVGLGIGPEGGFSDQEIQRLCEKGWRPVGLGPQILRVSTAVTVGLGLLHQIFLTDDENKNNP
jgi:16S rRNA (uracil1498-N3)-methyltransferase